MPFTIWVLKNLQHQLQAQKSHSEEAAKDSVILQSCEVNHALILLPDLLMQWF